MRREYKLAAGPVRWADRALRREILEITEGHREVLLVVADSDAVDVLEAIRRAYQDGREDNAPHYHSATGTEDTPCWCPSPARYAPRPVIMDRPRPAGDDSSEEEADVAMVCKACRKPVERIIIGATTETIGWHHVSHVDGAVCAASYTGIRAMVAAGNENVPISSEEKTP